MLGYWLAATAVPRRDSPNAPAPSSNVARWTALDDDPAPRFRRGERLPGKRGDYEAMLAGALEGQRVLVFKDQAALNRFVAKMGESDILAGCRHALFPWVWWPCKTG